jgi:hypothetical protein
MVDTAVFKTDALPGMRVQIPSEPPINQGVSLMKKHIQLKVLEDKLREKQQSIQILQAEAALLQSMIDEAHGRSSVPAPRTRAGRSNVKDAVLSLLQEVGVDGLNAALAVEKAHAKALTLDRGTVSSLLSRLKNEGVLAYDGRLYRLKEFATPPPPAPGVWGDTNVVAHPASKVSS